jgi:hypothetical protein
LIRLQQTGEEEEFWMCLMRSVIRSTRAEWPYSGERPHLILAGKKGKQEVTVEIYFDPFDDDKPSTVFDVNFGGWRENLTDEE